MTQDYINGIFELIGGLFTWKNAYQLYKDKAIKGVWWPMWGFFAVWGLWNLLYYPSLNQWASFTGGLLLVGGNIAWIVLLFWYRIVTKVSQPVVQKPVESDVPGRGWTCKVCGTWYSNSQAICSNLLCGKE